jgi:hypothetical protein
MVEPQDQKATQNIPLEKIELPGGIYDLTGEIREYIENDTPISEETLNILRTFDREYSFEKDISKRGREPILKRFDTALELFDTGEAKEAVKEGLLYAQKINPDIEIKPFPVVFLFIPNKGHATALGGQGCAINIDALREKDYLKVTPYENIVSSVAHESVHIFLEQLDKKPSYSDIERPLEERIYDFLWEEGLATYIEPHNYRHHDVIVKDVDFWIEVVKGWFKTDEVEEKKKILRTCKERDSCVSWLKDMYSGNLEDLSPRGDVDDIFMRMLSEMNGPGYHIGAYLWEKQIENGNSLKDLVMKGSEQMKGWVKEYIQEQGQNNLLKNKMDLNEEIKRREGEFKNEILGNGQVFKYVELKDPEEFITSCVNNGYVLHGTTRKLDELIPQKANDSAKEFGNAKAVYLTSSPIVAKFAALVGGADVGNRRDSKKTKISEKGVFTYSEVFFGVEKPENIKNEGYVYIFPKSVVDDTEGLEHISRKPIKPDLVVQIKREDWDEEKFPIERIG